MTNLEAKYSLNKIIDKARVHLYKPIQIAEILHRDRINKDTDMRQVFGKRSFYGIATFEKCTLLQA
jgi:type II restriction enzyme